MKTIRKQKLIFAWKWDTSNYPSLTEEQVELLEEHAEERAISMYTQHGYLSGELAYEDNDISVRGWWDVWKEKESVEEQS